MPPRTSRPSSGDEAALGRCTVRTLPARRLKVSAPRARPARRKTDGGGGVGETWRATGRLVAGAGAAAWWRVGVTVGWEGGGGEAAVCGWEVEAARVTTVTADFGAACGAGSGAGPRACGGAGSGDGPPATAGVATVANRARHATRTRARRAPIRSQLYDPRSSTTSPPQAVNANARLSGVILSNAATCGSEPQRPPQPTSEPRAPEPNREEPKVGEAEQHPELEHRSGVLDGRIGQRGHARRANGASVLRRS